ncbi:hypothetical protein GOP47_0028180 [Adiantum capillus-veneris]|nr:hypothetical protein GOP47_0028180 [Adiantum capillus-veneris]
MASFTISLSVYVPQLASPSQHLAKNMGSYSGLKCCQFPKKISLQAKRTSSFRPLRVSCQSTIEQVQDIIATKLSVDRATVQPQTKFSELGADSLDTVEIVMSLEEKFNVSIGEEDAENISTVQQVADLIEKQTTTA